MSNVAKKKITYHQSMLIVLLYINGFSSQRLGQRGCRNSHVICCLMTVAVLLVVVTAQLNFQRSTNIHDTGRLNKR